MRIRQARHELSLKQAELADRLRGSLPALDSFANGNGDTAGAPGPIVTVTETPAPPRYTPPTDDKQPTDHEPAPDREDAAHETTLPDALHSRLAESTGRAAPAAPPADPAPVAADQPALAPRRESLEEYTALARLRELEAAVVAEQHEHAGRVARIADELERAGTNGRAPSGLLEELSAALAATRVQEVLLTRRVRELESEVRAAEQRAADATAPLDDARSADLATREVAVGEALHDVSLRSSVLATQEAELRRRSAQLDIYQAELRLRSAQLDTREAQLGVREAHLRLGTMAVDPSAPLE